VKALRNPIFWIMIISLPFYFFELGSPGLSDSEAMYPEVAREMRSTNDWITPHLNGTPHLDKPPLLYWLIGISHTVFGETETAARIWTAACSWTIIFLVWATGNIIYGKRAAWLSSLIYATSIGQYIFSRASRPDMLLCFWISLAIFMYVRACRDDDIMQGPWIWGMAGVLGLAGLTKGLVGLGLPAGIICAHAIISGRIRDFISWKTVGLLFVTLLIFLPWHILISRDNPGFLYHYFIREHIERFSGQRFPVDEFLSLPVFLGLTFLWTFPWTFLLPLAVARCLKRMREGGRKAADLLPCVWAGIVIGLFSASGSRLEYYALPAMPAFAMLAGKLWDEAMLGEFPGSRRQMAVSVGLLSCLLCIGALAANEVLGSSKETLFRLIQDSWQESGWKAYEYQVAILETMRLPALVVLIYAAVASCGALAALAVSRTRLACGLLAGMMAPIFFMVHWGFLVMEPYHSARAAAEALSRYGPPELIVVQEPHEYMWIGGITYYTKFMVDVLKDPKYDNAAGHRREPKDRFIDRESIAGLFNAKEKIAFVVQDDAWQDMVIRGSGDRLDLLGRFGNRILLVGR
jgi:4-amino-4-deoxy-L-arabinose transferase-like glycosyltransferase